MQPSPIGPEELLRTYDTIILWVTWIFAVSAWLAALTYLLFLWVECLPLLRGPSRRKSSTPVLLLRDKIEGASKAPAATTRLVFRYVIWTAAISNASRKVRDYLVEGRGARVVEKSTTRSSRPGSANAE